MSLGGFRGHGNAAGYFAADFGFELDCNVHTTLKATLTKKRCALELCKHGKFKPFGATHLAGEFYKFDAVKSR